MSHSKFFAALLLTSMLAACTESDGSPGRGVMNGGALSKSDVGTAVGVIGGGVLGSAIGSGSGQVVATIGGALLGGMLGNSIGGSLDNADMSAYDSASQRALTTGRTQSWKNSSTGHYGSITPGKRTTDNGSCREYTQTIYVEGKKHSAHGIACRNPDGTWEILE